MDLYLLRHGPAGKASSTGSEEDAARVLKAKGMKRVRRVAKGMRAYGLSFDAILTSPYRRCQQTAELVAGVLGQADAIRPVPDLAPGGDRIRLLTELARGYAADACLLLVGHQPDLSGIVSVLTTGGLTLALAIDRAGMCKVTTGSTLRHGKCAELIWVMTPRQIAAMR